MDRLRQLHDAGTSVWLDALSREMLEDGALDEHIAERSVTGVTSNPSIFAAALRGSPRYDAQVADLCRHHRVDARELYLALAPADVRAAARALAGVHERSGGRDGWASFQLTPDIAENAGAMVAQAERVRRLVPAPNLMVKVPATAAGIAAVDELTARGMNVNVTLLFTPGRAEAAARAYQHGLRRRAGAGLPVDGVRSVLSVFVSRIDARVERLVGPDALPPAAAALAQAHAIRERLAAVFSGRPWDALRAAGAHEQRLLWASTAPKSAAYRDVVYVERLAAPGTIVTVPPKILAAFADHGEVGRSALDTGAAEELREGLQGTGVDLDRVGAELLDEGLEAFDRDFRRALADLGERAARLGRGSAHAVDDGPHAARQAVVAEDRDDGLAADAGVVVQAALPLHDPAAHE